MKTCYKIFVLSLLCLSLGFAIDPLRAPVGLIFKMIIKISFLIYVTSLLWVWSRFCLIQTTMYRRDLTIAIVIHYKADGRVLDAGSPLLCCSLLCSSSGSLCCVLPSKWWSLSVAQLQNELPTHSSVYLGVFRKTRPFRLSGKSLWLCLCLPFASLTCIS